MYRVESIRQHNAAVARELSAAEIAIIPARVTRRADGKWEKVPLIKEWRCCATYDLDQVTRWWRQFPDAVAGIELEAASLIVLDPDRHPGAPDGVAAFERLCANRVLPAHPITATPGGGFHHYFQQPIIPLGCGRGRLPPGVDVRGVGGWIVAPGVMRPDGALWQPVEDTPTLIEAFRHDAIPPLPRWLNELLRPSVVRHSPTMSSPRCDDEEVTQALLRTPADDRDIWLRVGAALKTQFGEDGRDLWDVWSARSEKFDPKMQEVTWHSLVPGRISIGTLFFYSKGGHAR